SVNAASAIAKPAQICQGCRLFLMETSRELRRPSIVRPRSVLEGDILLLFPSFSIQAMARRGKPPDSRRSCTKEPQIRKDRSPARLRSPMPGRGGLANAVLPHPQTSQIAHTDKPQPFPPRNLRNL